MEQQRGTATTLFAPPEMTVVPPKLTMREQIKVAMDGRSGRAVSLEIKIVESDWSKKMRGVMKFTRSEIDRFNTRFNANVIFDEEEE